MQGGGRYKNIRLSEAGMVWGSVFRMNRTHAKDDTGEFADSDDRSELTEVLFFLASLLFFFCESPPMKLMTTRTTFSSCDTRNRVLVGGAFNRV